MPKGIRQTHELLLYICNSLPDIRKGSVFLAADFSVGEKVGLGGESVGVNGVERVTRGDVSTEDEVYFVPLDFSFCSEDELTNVTMTTKTSITKLSFIMLSKLTWMTTLSLQMHSYSVLLRICRKLMFPRRVSSRKRTQ